MKSQSTSMTNNVAILDTFLKAQNRLVYQTSDLSLGSLSGMATPRGPKKKAAIDLDPDFQRRKRWGNEKQSALIESFLLNVPVPPIYLAEDEFGQYSVVDGKQRLTAIHAFMTDALRLTKLESFVGINGLTFSELPDDLQNALQIRPYVRVVTLLKQSDPALKFEVFTRLNRGGEAMLDQELRKVAYRGPLSNAIFELAETNTPLRRQLKIKSDSSKPFTLMEDAEYVLRFFTLSESWRTFSGGLRHAMDSFMAKNRAAGPSEILQLRARFQDTIAVCDSIWGKFAFQRHTGINWRDQFLAGVYDAEMLAVHELTVAERALAIKSRAKAIKSTADLFQDKSFDRAARQGTNTPSFVRKRVEDVLAMLRTL